MTRSLDPFRFLLMAVSGWMNQQQLELIDYLREENRVLREQLGQRRLRFNDYQRRGNEDLAIKNLVGAFGYMLTAMNNLASIAFNKKPRK